MSNSVLICGVPYFHTCSAPQPKTCSAYRYFIWNTPYWLGKGISFWVQRHSKARTLARQSVNIAIASHDMLQSFCIRPFTTRFRGAKIASGPSSRFLRPGFFWAEAPGVSPFCTARNLALSNDSGITRKAKIRFIVLHRTATQNTIVTVCTLLCRWPKD